MKQFSSDVPMSTDTERTVEALKGITGKRLTYRRTGKWATA
ncbi:hypothetical protein VH569_11285 [Azospirillum sp. 11R-A]